MLFPHGRWLLCTATYFDVKYEINPWMSIARTPHTERAMRQWVTLHHTILRLGAWVEYAHPDPNCPDMVFTANAGLVKGKRVVLSRFKHKERQGEVPYFAKYFKENGYEVLELSEGEFEGEGDALFAGDVLFCGYGFRSKQSVYSEVARLLGVKETVLLELRDPRFYHLDTCFCPLNAKQAIFFPGGFSAEGVKTLRERLDLFEVPEQEAIRFACNAVVLGKNVILPSGCGKTGEALRRFGYEPYEVELDEFMKAGGAAKCLSLRL